MKTLLFLILMFLCSCGQWSRTVATYTGYDIQCVDGVSYLQFTSGVTVQYTADGKIKNCQK